MRLPALLALSLCFSVFASGPDEKTDAESEALNHALEEAGPSPVDFIRALEDHLQKYPNSPRRAEIERGLVRGAVDAKDYRRIVQYGERVLARDPTDADVLEQVATAELKSHNADDARKALDHARVLETLFTELAKEAHDKPNPGPRGASRIIEIDVRLATAVMLEARGYGVLGDGSKAAELSRRSFEISPSAAAAREAGYWYNQLGNPAEAVKWLADAFTISDPRSSEADRNQDRELLGEVYRKWKGSEAGLGDVVLAAWDRNREVIAQRRLMLKQYDPNIQLSDPMDFTLTGVDGTRLKMSSLRGKVVVMDFWATWCGPCRVQHPLYDKVKEKYRNHDDVVFLAIDVDEDHSLVPQFLATNRWSYNSYFEDGLSALLKVSSIPTTIVVGEDGSVVSRMTGFDPDRFVAMLSERIDEALKSGKTSAASRP